MNYLNEMVCSKCGGECCKRMPGSNHPKDFGDTDEEIKKNLIMALRSHDYAIDWWEGEPQQYFIRPATKNSNRLFDPSWGGECVFLLDKCTLSPEKRPYQCRMLEPHDKECINHGTPKKGSIDWIPYIPMILEIGAEVERQS